MRAFTIRLIAVLLLFAAVILISGRIAKNITDRNMGARNVVVLRITSEIENELAAGADAETAKERVFDSRRQQWNQLYGCEHSPDEVNIILFDDNAGMTSDRLSSSDALVCGIYDGEELIGIAQYRFSSSVYSDMMMLIYAVVAVCAVIFLIWGLWIRHSILVPFNRLSEYPERISKGGLTEKLPETKNRFFGRYIWGMNMLSDKLENDRRTISRLSIERKEFITALVHGIKTPAANIKLLSEAISTGLYSPDGKVNEKDAELAGRIEKNADDIEKLVKQVLDSSTNEIFDFDPDTKPFYRSALIKIICEEYADSMKVKRIPFEVQCSGDLMINSDINGICRILRQLIDNAVKYGDGTGITISMEKNDEGHFITVSNKGTPLPDSELPFVWGSMWRGSNSHSINGSGVGLYESKLIAKKLGGDILMRTSEDTTEVVLFLPL